MKILYALPLLFLAACARDSLSTAQHVQVNLTGTEVAYCVLSTDDNRYALRAPGEVLVERDDNDLKIDCQDNLSSRRRTIKVASKLTLNYFAYPDVVNVDFSTVSNEYIKNGYRLQSTDANITEILTEDSYSKPVIKRTIIRKYFPKVRVQTFEQYIENNYVSEKQPVSLMSDKETMRLMEIEKQSLEALSLRPDQPIVENMPPSGRHSHPVR